MKIRLSFVPRPVPWQPAAIVLWAIAALAAGAAFVLAKSARDNRDEHARLELRLHHADELLARRTEVNLPGPEQSAALRRRIGELNGLAGVKGWSTPHLLLWLEQHTPAEVHFLSVHHEPREGEVLLVAASGTSVALTSFLRTLENEPRFAEVLLSKQGGRAGSTDVQVEIRLRLRT